MDCLVIVIVNTVNQSRDYNWYLTLAYVEETQVLDNVKRCRNFKLKRASEVTVNPTLSKQMQVL